MSTAEIIKQRTELLPDILQKEVADFVDYLLLKFEKKTDENHLWTAFSMQNAIRGFEDDPVTYTKNDIKNRSAV